MLFSCPEDCWHDSDLKQQQQNQKDPRPRPSFGLCWETIGMPDLLDQIVDTGVHPAAVDCSLTLLLCGQRVQSDSPFYIDCLS